MDHGPNYGSAVYFILVRIIGIFFNHFASPPPPNFYVCVSSTSISSMVILKFAHYQFTHFGIPMYYFSLRLIILYLGSTVIIPVLYLVINDYDLFYSFTILYEYTFR